MPCMLCPVVSEGTGGAGEALAESTFRDAEHHVNLKEDALLQMQGKVMDGQYIINGKFITGMNNPLTEVLGALASTTTKKYLINSGG